MLALKGARDAHDKDVMNTASDARLPDATTARLRTRRDGMLRIVHISDLHIVSNTDFTALPWAGLVNAVNELKPDLIVATGDIADNPWSELLSNRRRSIIAKVRMLASRARSAKGRNWDSTLETVLRNARSFLERLCMSAELDVRTQLKVIPGNHDYRVQGIFARDGEAHARG